MKRKKPLIPNPEAAVALYNRVSTARQRDGGVSINDQANRLQAAYPEGVLYTDPKAVSGTVPLARRIAGRQLLDDIAAGKVRKVVVTELTRAFRSAIDAMSTVAEWRDRGIELAVLNLGGVSIDTSTAGGSFLFGVLALSAQFESEMTSERVTNTWDACKRSGRKMGRTGLGYANHSPETVARMEALRAQGLPYRAIATKLDEEGYLTHLEIKTHQKTHSKRWTWQSVQYALTIGVR